MRPLSEHLAEAVSLVSPLPAERVPLLDGMDRVLAEDVIATLDGPAFDNSAMDGYAVRVADAVAGAVLPVAADIPAGSGLPAALAPGSAARIMTGAPLPAGADAVVPVEATDGGVVTVEIREDAVVGAHIRRRGEDVRVGDVVVAAGVALGSWQLSAAASAGAAEIAVRARPRIAVLTTGDELVDPGTTPGPGQIVDSNTTLLAAMVKGVGGIPVILPRAGDTPEAVLASLEGVEVDLIVTAGGASVGAYDPVKAALADRGVGFHAVAMQPGKPQGLGTYRGIPVACLPGNPVSVAVTFSVVVGAMMRAMLGAPEPSIPTAPAAVGWASPPGRAQFVPAVFDPNGALRPATAGGSRSHLVASLAKGRVLAVVPAEVDEVLPGDTVSFMLSHLEILS
ncbi:gephyrin-like molybdotransferase Glp [Demequina sp. NBRC 110057]|uniref:molybdopterin molybdotransferase MoeA n=1 Tax=Demequina sp. NBRC 110057 TaxID=1570346 RepID=UPI0009FDFF8A|nr:gephyrin-like molybdotransferase Glp [Demequina sp. NBRC 110057]